MHRFLFGRFLAILVICLVVQHLCITPVHAFRAVDGILPASLPDTVIIHQIRIRGNAITKKEIILRELKFKVLDTIPLADFSQLVVRGRENIFNTRLFNFVTIDTSYCCGTQLLDIDIAVIERWYIWPFPYVEISDRNFNVWWESRDFSRLTYGVDFTFFNVRGRNETLRILTHFGFNQKFGFTYKIPYINQRQTVGAGFGLDVQLNHELPVLTLNNDPVYLRSNSTYLKKLVYGYADLIFRPDLYTTNLVRLAYSRYNFDSAIIAVPGFSLSPNETQHFFSFTYQYKADHRDIHYYPLTGYYIDAEVNHTIPYSTAHNSFFRTNLRIYRQLYHRWYWASGFTGKISFAKVQPYYLQRGLGWGRDYIRGYEYYVVDGQHFAVLKSNLKFAILPQRVEQIGFIRSAKFNTIPIACYLNAFVDMGFAYKYPGSPSSSPNDGNTLENTFLAGYGLGVDFTTYYDVVVRIEGAMNRMNQPGIYLHFIAPI